MDQATIETVEKEKPYQFRELVAKDIPLVTNVIKAIGLKEFKHCLSKDVIDSIMNLFVKKEGDENESVDYTTLGISLLPTLLEIAEIVLDNIEKCETALFKLLAHTSNLSVSEVENLSLGNFTEMVYDFVKKDEFPDFFKVVLKLLKRTK